MPEQELKPCPKCSWRSCSLQSMHYGVERFISGWFVECNNHNCYFEGPIKKTSEEAIESWNRRTPCKE